MITEKTINIPIYDNPLDVVVFDTEKEVHEKYPEIFSEGTKACVAECFSDGKILIMVPSRNLYELAHEAVHVVNCIYRLKGIQPQRDNDEHEAYLTGYIFKRIEEIIRKHNSSR